MWIFIYRFESEKTHISIIAQNAFVFYLKLWYNEVIKRKGSGD